MEHKQMTP